MVEPRCRDHALSLSDQVDGPAFLELHVIRVDLDERARGLAGNRAHVFKSRGQQQVGSGDRSERIRTYNYPQGRVSDHRINLTLHRLPEIIEGAMDELIDALIAEDQAQRLAGLGD